MKASGSETVKGSSGGQGTARPTRPAGGLRMEKYFLPYQVRWIEDRSPKRIMEKSRQVGMTFCSAYDLVRKTSFVRNPFDAWVSSSDELQAELFGMDCATWARLSHRCCGNLECQVLDPKEKITAHVLPFQNGRAIYSLSSNPNAQAGKRGRRVFDEFALNPENRLLYSIGQPGTMWGGGMDIISTHRGSENYFNELVNEARWKGNPKGFSLHKVTVLDAVKDGLLGKLQDKWREGNPGDDRLRWTEDDFLQHLRSECADEETWQQEFLCVPGDDNAAFLSYELIAGCEYQPGVDWELGIENLKSANELYLGVDIGRIHDLTVIWALEKVSGDLFTRAVICLQNATFDAQEEVLYRLLALPTVRRACIDQTGIGRQFAERAAQRFGRYKVEGIHFTSGVKEELAYATRTAFEKKTVRIPADKYIRADLRSMRKEATASGNIRFTGERTSNGHADRFWGLALALHAAKQSTTTNRIFAQLI
jgi:phage FluMu gp28-like protein